MIKNIKNIELTHSDYKQITHLYNIFGKINKPVLTFLEFKTIIANLPDTHNVYLYYINDNIVGAITLLIEQKLYNIKIGNIKDCVVLLQYRDYDIDTKLLNFIVNQSIKNNCTKLNIECKEYLEKAYNKYGFYREGIYMTKCLN